MKIFFTLICCLISLCALSQEFIGQILDSTNEQPVSFVNVGILRKNIGTVSDTNGRFKINVTPDLKNDTIRLSCIGYQSKDILIKKISDYLLNQDVAKITLDPQTYELIEAKITSGKPKIVTLGNPIRDNNNIKIRTDSLLGSEIGLVINTPRKNKKYKLKDFTFNLADHHFEAEIRINIYNLVNSKPSNNILRQPIYFTIPSDLEILTVDLSDYNVIVEDDFFISIENFKEIPSMDKRLKINGVSGLGKSGCFYRMVSQGDWNKIPLVGVQFKVTAFMY